MSTSIGNSSASIQDLSAFHARRQVDLRPSCAATTGTTATEVPALNRWAVGRVS